MTSGIHPLLAHVYEPKRVTFPCYVQPKLNGIRALYQNGRFQSRDLVPFPEILLQHLAKPLLEIFDPSVILDGELYVHGWPLQRINAAVTPVRQTPTEDTVQVQFHVFDVVDYKERFHVRQQLRQRAQNIHCVETYIVDDEETANRRYAEFVSNGYEGMMYRLGTCPYTVPNQPGGIGRARYLADKHNRVWHLLKRKDWQDDEFMFDSLNATIGEKGERGFQMWCKTKEGKSFKVSSGLSRAELDHYLANPPIGRQIKIKYLVFSEERKPLNATILCIL